MPDMLVQIQVTKLRSGIYMAWAPDMRCGATFHVARAAAIKELEQVVTRNLRRKAERIGLRADNIVAILEVTDVTSGPPVMPLLSQAPSIFRAKN